MSPRARAAIGAVALLGCVLVVGGSGSYLLARRTAVRFFAGLAEIGQGVDHVELWFRPGMDPAGRLKLWTAAGCRWPRECCDLDPELQLTATGAIAATGPPDLREWAARRRQILAVRRDKGCRRNPAVVEPCFQVDGRTFIGESPLGLELAVEGSKRVLQVVPADGEAAPDCLVKAVAWDGEVRGRFTVCPFTRQEAGTVQQVCVEEVEAGVVRTIPPAGQSAREQPLGECRLYGKGTTR